MKIRCVAESTIKRQAILDACEDKALLMSEVSKITGNSVTAINHHLVKLVDEGYLEKTKARIEGVSLCAYVYRTVKDEPYVMQAEVERAPTPHPAIQFPADFPMGLMRMMGYLRV